MRDDDSIMLSVSPEYARSILAGVKGVELRRRAPRISPGTRAWLYSTLPVGEVVAILTIDQVVEAPLTELWHRYGAHTAVTREVFSSYFAGLTHGAALVIRDVQALKTPVSLREIRESEAFQPPQFYRRVRAGAAAARLTMSELHPKMRLAVG
ncbi:ASCH domain-containing protein [Brevundimonas mediterranea]|uniref:Putative transcriptional regulator n=1 Tax=Brevundimonas mediterranea TaxID=74329 RepID=A0A7W6A665_9CAUL|nr:ASCH domain-containing protein [Brevundimonas mediterranea]MBB3872897.1 putative transcriptional regulator [Brevundimonas mediterranea]